METEGNFKDRTEAPEPEENGEDDVALPKGFEEAT